MGGFLKTTLIAVAACAASMVGAPWAAAQDAPAPDPETLGVVDQPCPPPLQEPPELQQILRAPNRPPMTGPPPPAIARFLQAQQERARADWAGLCRYRADDAALAAANAPPPKAVFLGDSITEGWARTDGDFYAANRFVGRGISGQVTGQALLRFEQDVVALRPRVVHIMIGTNDVAGNAGPTTYRNIQDNITAMVALARANHIAVVLATIPPSSDFPWRPGMHPAQKIIQMNDWIRAYAKREHLVVADYHRALRDPAGGFRADWTVDGVHPNAAGFKVMEPIADAAVKAALADR